MPLIRFTASKRQTYVVAVILSLSKIIFIYSRYTKKKLVCIVIVALSSYQPSFCAEYTKSNI